MEGDLCPNIPKKWCTGQKYKFLSVSSYRFHLAMRGRKLKTNLISDCYLTVTCHMHQLYILQLIFNYNSQNHLL